MCKHVKIYYYYAFYIVESHRISYDKDKTGYSIITMYSKNKDINHKVENHSNYLYNHCWWILASSLSSLSGVGGGGDVSPSSGPVGVDELAWLRQ